jgi:putative transposase
VLADRFISETWDKEGIQADQLTIHADRGTSMTSKLVVQLMADLGVVKSHSRPHTSNDNPYSEAHFKTMKYCPEFPGSFGSLEDAKRFCRGFFEWYNTRHHHGGLGYLTPDQVHHGEGPRIQEIRKTVLAGAYAAHPERFVNGPPSPPPLPTAAWINPPVPGTPGLADDPPKPSKAQASEDAPHSHPAL